MNILKNGANAIKNGVNAIKIGVNAIKNGANFKMTKSIVSPEDDIFFTRPMAGLLEDQGQMEDAFTIYKILAAAAPEDQVLSSKVRDLKTLAMRKRGARKARRAR